jgi:AraC family transcriptional regulator
MPAIAELKVPSAKLAELHVPCASIEVVTFEWPYPAEMAVVSDRPMLSLWSGTVGYRSAGRFVGDAAQREEKAIGSVFFMPAEHELASHGTGGPVKAVRCRFDPAYFEHMTGSAGGLTRSQMLEGLDIRSASVRFLLRRLMEEALSPGFGSAPMAECLAGMLAVEWAREAIGTDPEPPARAALTQRQFRAVADRLLDAERPFPSVAELSRLCGFGDRRLQFCRAFKKLAGHTLTEYLAQARIERAQHLLLTTDLGLKEIAYRLGFSSPANFSTAFKAATDLPPGAFRQRRQARRVWGDGET